MRSGLAGLTLRGRAFVAAGATAIGCAVLLGQTTLVRIGVLAFALPLVAAFFVGRRRYRVTTARTIRPRMVSAGQSARVDLEIVNDGTAAAGALLVEDQVPYALGSRPRFVLQGLGRRWRRTVHYQVRSDVRGHFAIGPLTLRSGDPFGLLQMEQTVAGTAALIVTPRTVALPRQSLTGGWSGSGEHRPQAFAAGSAEDVSVREYRRGDELRRVHWRSSARVGQLMVRKEEQPWEAQATVLLDNRSRAHRGKGLGSSFEPAVSAAASIALHLDHQGFTVRFATADGSTTEAGESAGSLLERLAVVRAEPAPSIDTRWLSEGATGGLLVAVLGRVDDSDLPALRRLRHHCDTALAVVLDVDQWPGTASDPSRAIAAPVIGAGWRAVELGSDDRLETVWTTLTHHNRRGAATGTPPAYSSEGGIR